MLDIQTRPGPEKARARLTHTPPALNRDGLALQAKLGGGLPLTSLSPADRAGLDNLSRRGAVRFLLSAGTVYVTRARP